MPDFGVFWLRSVCGEVVGHLCVDGFCIIQTVLKISASEISMTLNSFLCSCNRSCVSGLRASLFCLDWLVAALVEVNVRSRLWQQTLSTTEEEVGRLWSVLESGLK